VKERLRSLLVESLEKARRAGALRTSEANIELEKPRQEGHGDWATNLAMTLARQEKKPPRQVAQIILEHLAEGDGFIARVEVAGPGFINFFLSDSVWRQTALEVLRAGRTYGFNAELGRGRRIQVEFVSANPTGPLHVGHGRGAAVGDALANLLQATGHEVEREYYINDAGRQMLILGRSVFVRYLQLLGRQVELPEESYRGEYVKDLAAEMVRRHGPAYADLDMEAAARLFFPQAAAEILAGIKRDLAGFGVEYNVWFSESSLLQAGRMEALLARLEESGLAYKSEGALWYRTQEQGDEKDRVLVKSNGDLTYFATDVAYHTDKFDRGFDWVIDVWGADHHGYVPRMDAAVRALSQGGMKFTAKLVQLVNLLRGGEPVAMSTRAGEFVTLAEVVEEVGRDACRFIFLTRRSDSPLDFDLDLARQQSMDNPVYYVQYVHARVCSILRKASPDLLDSPEVGRAELERLAEPEEIGLLKLLAQFPEVVRGAAEALEPHRVTYYLTELAAAFHNCYNRHRVLSDDFELSRARLALALAVRQVVANGLGLLGVSAPERMDREDEPGTED